jgi:hypothetical protein
MHVAPSAERHSIYSRGSSSVRYSNFNDERQRLYMNHAKERMAFEALVHSVNEVMYSGTQQHYAIARDISPLAPAIVRT